MPVLEETFVAQTVGTREGREESPSLGRGKLGGTIYTETEFSVDSAVVAIIQTSYDGCPLIVDLCSIEGGI